MKFVCFLSLLVSFNQNLASSFLPADSGQTQLGSTGSQVERTTSVASGDQNVREENRRVNSPVEVSLWGFGVFIMLISIVLAIRIPQPTDFQIFIFRGAFAMAVGAIGMALSGFISLGIGNGTRATGGVALFLLVYAFNPARLIKK
jgi:hypothetical protein